jgi:hypothetical protein
MEGTVIMEYQLSITFADLGHRGELPDRLLTILLERFADGGPAVSHNQVTGELTIMLAFDSSAPIGDASRLSEALGRAMFDVGLEHAPTILDVHLAAIHAGDITGVPGVLSPA